MRNSALFDPPCRYAGDEVAGAEALRDNAYKTDMVKGAVEESVLGLA
jgi:hypothetical protein